MIWGIVGSLCGALKQNGIERNPIAIVAFRWHDTFFQLPRLRGRIFPKRRKIETIPRELDFFFFHINISSIVTSPRYIESLNGH